MEDWDSPLQLIGWGEKGQVGLIEETITILRAINKPLVIPCIAGSYRTGKSYLMNRLSGRKTGFQLGNTIQSQTKGLWVWLTNYPNDPTKGLLLLDTEGLDDPQMGDGNDANILCLSLLLCSTFIYNCTGRVDNVLIDKMDFVTEISQHVRIKSEVNVVSNSDFYHVFPHFVLVCRDAILDLEMDGETVTSDECMERVMLTADENVTTRKGRMRNETKLKLRKYFPKRKCFFLRRPVEKDCDMKRLEQLAESDLQEEFLTESEKFCSYVLDNSTVKSVENIDVNGEKFVQLVEMYTEAINKGAVPCVGNAYDLFASIENERLITECVAKYKESMSELQFPLESSEFSQGHLTNHKIAMEHFGNKFYLIGEDKHFTELQEKLCLEFSNSFDENNEKSAQVCSDILNKEFLSIDQKLKEDAYNSRKGYGDFLNEWPRVTLNYEKVSNKGIAANVALRLYETRFLNYHKTLLEKFEAGRWAEEDEKVRLRQVEVKLEVERELSKAIEERIEMIVATREIDVSIFTQTCRRKLDESTLKSEELFWIRKQESSRLLREDLTKEVEQLEIEIEAAAQERANVKWKIFKMLRIQNEQMEDERKEAEELKREFGQYLFKAILNRALKPNKIVSLGLGLRESKNPFKATLGDTVVGAGILYNLFPDIYLGFDTDAFNK